MLDESFKNSEDSPDFLVSEGRHKCGSESAEVAES